MKATLTFNLDDFDDRREHMIALKGKDMLSVLWHFQEDYLRQEIKRGNHSASILTVYQDVQRTLIDLLHQEMIDINELYQ